jgi:flagellar hook-length control protein FliK
VTAAATPAAPAGGDAPVAAQLGRQIAVLRNAPDGSQTMTVVITPESLGPVTVEVTVTDGKLDLTLHGAHPAGRHALTEALPELRRELEGAGLSFDKLVVDPSNRDAGAGLRNPQQQLLDARAGQQGSSGQPGQQEPRARSWGSSPDSPGEGAAALTTDQSTSSGVDVRV